jgi:hypothetical protein
MHFCSSIHGICHFHHGVVRTIKRFAPIYVGTWQGTWRHYKRNTQFKAQALASQRSLEMTLDPTPLPLAWLFHTRTLAHVGVCLSSVCIGALAPWHSCNPFKWNHCNPSPFHPLAEVDLPPFVNDFHLKMNLVLDWKTFIFVLTHSSCLSSNGHSGVVYEFLWDLFCP